MSQALRVALFVPTEDPPEVGDGIVTKANEIAADVLPTRFLLGGGSGGGGIPEAPIDGTTYGRKDAGWVPATGGSGGISEAPQDGTPYLRQNAGWVAFPAVIDGGTF